MFNILHRAECGGTFSDANGTLRSPLFPFNAPPNRDCEYLITQPEDAIITLEFTSFAVESSHDGACRHDYLVVRAPQTSDKYMYAITDDVWFLL